MLQDIDLAEWGIGAMAGNPDEPVPEVQEETSRLAVLDLDWSKVHLLSSPLLLRPRSCHPHLQSAKAQRLHGSKWRIWAKFTSFSD